MADAKNQSIDIDFSVPFVHRLRVTADVAGGDFHQLRDVLIPGGSDAAKTLVVVETAVANSSDRIVQLSGKLNALAEINVVGSPLLVEGGEPIKNSTDVVKDVLRAINQHDLDRRSYIITIGGGAMLDVVGYAAAVAHRGIRLIRIPTTTLAQGDSGVGVKNAINYFGKKNWIGTFAVPWAVINDAAVLSTLSDRDFRSGFSESVKVSLLKDRGEFDWLCDNAAAIRQRDMAVASRAIHRSCMLHLLHITEGGDPFEMLEARPLDFGHWSAHKLEPLTGYKIRHGEAVAIGVAIDCIYSSLQHGLAENDALRVCECLTRMGMRLWHKELQPVDRLMDGLEEFRQHLGGRLTITMLNGVGQSINVHEIDTSAMKRAIGRLQQIASELENKLQVS
jgi:3-dehydroquinate synthase